jgi:hypothetical protein
VSGSTERAAGRGRASLGSRLALALGALLVGLVLSEVGLQIAGLVARRVVQRGSGGEAAGDFVTILCVGDSHTYGLPLPESESYPAQLEAALAARHPQLALRVVNLGVPGLNSAFVANRLERQIYQLQPDLVIVWVGINNLWNVVESLRWEREDPWLPLRRRLMHLKLFRLASIAWFNSPGHRYDPAERGGWFEGELQPSGRLQKGVKLPDPAPGLARDLERMTELAHGLDTPILFVTYPMRAQQPISEVIEATGGRLGVGVIDTAAELRRALADGLTPDALIDREAGPHPSGVLYGYVVRAMVPVVERTLASWRGLDLPPAGTTTARPR